jgi:hypothetical protein
VRADPGAFQGFVHIEPNLLRRRNISMLNRILMVAVVAVLFAAAGTSGSRAQQPMGLGQQASAPPGWTFDVAPYVWFANINTDLSFNLPPALGGTVTASPSIGFGDLLSHLNFALMGAADAQYDRFSVVTDFMYMNLAGTPTQFKEVNFPNHPAIPVEAGINSSQGLDLNATIWTLAGGYTLAQGGWGNFDMIAGFRLLAINTRIDYSLGLTITGPRGNGATFGGIGSVSSSGDIWNGIGGFRGRVRVGNAGLFIPYYFDIGAGGSNLTWQISSGLGYHAGPVDLSLTYRYLSFSQSGPVERLWMKGPMLMASFAF